MTGKAEFLTRRLLVCLAVWAVACLGRPAAGQTTSAILSGRVVTPSGDGVGAALVQARAESSGTLRTAMADGDGRFRFDAIAPGTWSVVARSPDGVLSDTKSVTLRLQQTVAVNLTVGTGLEENVEVRADVPLLEPQRTGSELRILDTQAQELPIAGRAITDLALLDSSVRPAAASSYYGERAAPFVVNGQTGRSNSYLVDGLDNNDIASGTSLNASFSDLVISEFVVLTHQFAPEFGRASGGIMNILTQRGTNSQEMLGFVEGAPSGWGASGDLVNGLPDSPGVQDAPSNWSAGLRWGGPFKKDKAFWFAAYEHQEQTAVIPYSGTTPDGVAGGRYAAPSRDDNVFLRTDVNIDPANTLMVRLSYDDRTNGGVNVGGITTPQFGFTLGERDLQLGAALTTVINPNLIHEIRVLASDSSFEQQANSSDSGVERPSSEFGGNNLNHQDRKATTYQLVQNLTWVKGHHTTKFGYDVTPSHTRVAARFNPNGNFIYQTDAPFQPGDCGGISFTDLPQRCSGDHATSCSVDADTCPSQGKGHCEPDYDDPVPCPGTPGVDDNGDGRIDEPALPRTYPQVFQLIEGAPTATLDDTQIAAFAEDTWQAAPRWILDYGLRYDLSTYTLPKSLAVPSSIPNGGAPRDTNNLAPRLGFTYTAGANRDWIIRGGAGIFYNKTVLAFPAVAAITSGTSIGLLFPQGFLYEITEDVIKKYGIDAIKPGLVFPENLILRFSTGTQMDAAQSNQFNLGFDKSVRGKGLISVNAGRVLTYHIPLMRDLNPVVGQTIDGIPIHRDQTVGSIAAITTEGRAWYTGLDLGWKWQEAAGWYSLQYTLSKSEDLGPDPLKGGIYLPPNSDDISQERGRSDDDRRHRFVASGDIRLGLLGMRLSGVYQWASALTFNVTTGKDDNLDGITSDRPAGVGRNTGVETPLSIVNEFRTENGLPTVPALSAPYLSQLDLKVYRPFTFRGGKAAGQAFVQVLNVFNRFNGGEVEGRLLARNFGQVVSQAGPPRMVALGLKMGF